MEIQAIRNVPCNVCNRVQPSEKWDTLNKGSSGYLKKNTMKLQSVRLLFSLLKNQTKKSSSLDYHICKDNYISKDIKVIKVSDKVVFNFRGSRLYFED